MGKLGEFLKELKEEKSKNPFQERQKLSKRRLFFLSLVVFLFFGAVIVGFYLTQLFKLESLRKEKPQPPKVVATKPPILAENSTQKEIPTEKRLSSPEILGSQKSLQKNLVKRESKKPKPVAKKKGFIESEKRKERTETITTQVYPPLRERGLLENLLLNAEEERKKGNYQGAIKFYEEFLKYKKDPEVYNNLGGLYFLIGDFQRAKTTFETALSLKYDSVFEINYIMALLKLNQTKRACEELLNKNFPPDLEDKVKFLKSYCK